MGQKRRSFLYVLPLIEEQQIYCKYIRAVKYSVDVKYFYITNNCINVVSSKRYIFSYKNIPFTKFSFFAIHFTSQHSTGLIFRDGIPFVAWSVVLSVHGADPIQKSSY
jgi:hypothetical protein